MSSSVILGNSSTRALMTTLNATPKANASTGLTIEQITDYAGAAWVPYKIKWKKERYFERDDRYEVMLSDELATVHTKRWPKWITHKPFKSYDTDIDGQPEEIMTEVWERWEQLNMNEALRDIMKYCCADGYCIARFYLTQEMALGYQAYGYYQCQPQFFHRVNAPLTPNHNKIFAYHISYIPQPQGTMYTANYNMHAEDFFLYPNAELETHGYKLFHFYRGEYNSGIGSPLLQEIWDSITKLRKMSWHDFKRSCSYPIVEIPADMDPGTGEAILKAWRNWDERNGMGVIKRINPNTQETEDFPRVYERCPDQTGAMPKGDPSSGGSMLRSSEYARYLAPTGKSEVSIVGSQPGAVEGSKLDLTKDDRADMSEFAMYTRTIKSLLTWLLEIGALDGIEEDSAMRIMEEQYEIKCHVEWEVLENMMAEAEMMEEEAEGLADEGKDNTSIDNIRLNAFLFNPELYNNDLFATLGDHMINNAAMPMTPTASSWIKGIGFQDNTLFFETHTGAKYKKTLADAEQFYRDWADSGSKGGFWWDYLSSPSNKWEKTGRIPLPKMYGYKEYQSRAKEMREFKMKGDKDVGGAGETRDPMTFKMKGKKKPLKTKVKAGGTAKASRSAPAASRAAPAKSTPTEARAKRPKAKANVGDFSYNKLNSALKGKFGVGMSKQAFTNVRILLEELDRSFRYNSMSLGKVMDFDIPLFYMKNGKWIKEFACKKEFRKIVNHSGDLKLYGNLEHQGDHIKVGTYEYFWDEDKDYGVAKFDYDKEMIMNNVPKNSNIYNRLIQGLEPEMSTEYYADNIDHEGKSMQVNFRDMYGEPKLRGIAIVERGNCGSEVCEFESIKDDEE